MDGLRKVLSFVWSKWQRVAHGITRVINLTLLLLLYIFAIGPTAIVMKLLGQDILDTRWEPGAARESYWLSRPPVDSELRRYQQQF